MVRLVSSQGALAVRAHRDDPWDQMQQVLGAKQQGHAQRRGEEDRRARRPTPCRSNRGGREKKAVLGKYSVIRYSVIRWICEKIFIFARAETGTERPLAALRVDSIRILSCFAGESGGRGDYAELQVVSKLFSEGSVTPGGGRFAGTR